MGRDKKAGELSFDKILPAAGETKARKASASQLRAAEVRKWRKVLQTMDDVPGLLGEEEAAVRLRAMNRLTELKAPWKG